MTKSPSKTFNVIVMETRAVEVIYTVEAENEQEAREKAEQGDTIDSFTMSNSFDIIGRNVWDVEEIENV